jgi:hypothetical protein
MQLPHLYAPLYLSLSLSLLPLYPLTSSSFFPPSLFVYTFVCVWAWMWIPVQVFHLLAAHSFLFNALHVTPYEKSYYYKVPPFRFFSVNWHTRYYCTALPLSLNFSTFLIIPIIGLLFNIVITPIGKFKIHLAFPFRFFSLPLHLLTAFFYFLKAYRLIFLYRKCLHSNSENRKTLIKGCFEKVIADTCIGHFQIDKNSGIRTVIKYLFFHL